jgi:hypothetical protein
MDANNCSFDDEAGFDDGSCGSGIYNCSDGSTGCGCDGACGDTLETPAVEDCNDVCDGGAILVCLPEGGEDCQMGVEVCNEPSYNAGECDVLNEWNDCSGTHCGLNDPLFYETGCGEAGFIACDGGRCYTCDSPSYDNYQDCVDNGQIWSVALDTDGNDVITEETSCTGVWIEFADEDYGSGEAVTEDVEEGDPNECYCTAENAESGCEETSCPIAPSSFASPGTLGQLVSSHPDSAFSAVQ